MNCIFQVAPRPLYQKSKPERNPAYLAFIRKLPCSVCCKQWGIEAAHMGPHGIGQKSSDLDTIPLCRSCHRTGNDSYHKLGPRKFAERHKLDVPAIITKLNTFWKDKLAA